MSTEARELVVRTRSAESAVILSAAGEVDIVSAPTLSAAVGAALATDSAVLVVDLSGVGFFGSAGLSVLVEALESIGGRRLKVVASPQVRRPIEVTGLDDLLDVYGTLEEALAE
ncbi:anti-sigma factor antagonist [Nocardia sp. SYP-A9097]|uniref:STAS domain-containing protein n=1 Tax=Nocardia sp. SYP-A9097 TaxID=2663237 RepID=UPI001323C4A2|nr:STAS domain-containing protein [Nocardia sp. SYP-A9097]MRH89616.1 anti-sigma factor antagonist [Nocardia sp. SYP-A9097]